LHRNRATIGEVMTPYRLSRRHSRRRNTISGFGDITVFKRSKPVGKPNFDATSRSTAEIYNYFQFGKQTNVRHTGILLPVSISTISP